MGLSFRLGDEGESLNAHPRAMDGARQRMMAHLIRAEVEAVGRGIRVHLGEEILDAVFPEAVHLRRAELDLDAWRRGAGLGGGGGGAASEEKMAEERGTMGIEQRRG
jgi:hypothetical protein